MINNGNLLIFQYAPRLTIAGCFHSLDERDKSDLSRLVSDADFVALETDEIRMRCHPVFHIDLNAEAPYVNEAGFLVVSSNQDFLFLSEFSRYIGQFNVSLSKYGSRRRTSWTNELEFCASLAREQGKPVHLVDLPLSATYLRLLSLSKERREACLQSRMDPLYYTSDMRDILLSFREEYMLGDIEAKEGAKIENLARNGLLVTGVYHAKNYFLQKRQALANL